MNQANFNQEVFTNDCDSVTTIPTIDQALNRADTPLDCGFGYEFDRQSEPDNPADSTRNITGFHLPGMVAIKSVPYGGDEVPARSYARQPIDEFMLTKPT